MPPVGEGKDDEEDENTLIASFTDLRPYLDWSETKGWTLPTTAVTFFLRSKINYEIRMQIHISLFVFYNFNFLLVDVKFYVQDGRISSRAELIFPSKQGCKLTLEIIIC